MPQFVSPEKVSSSCELCNKLKELADGVCQQAPAGLFTVAGKVSQAAAQSAGQLQQLAHLHKVVTGLPMTACSFLPLHLLRQHSEAHCMQVLVEELKYIERPFEWAYEGLGPLLLRDVLETRRGISLSLTILFSCIARRLGLSLTPVPVSQIGKLPPLTLSIFYYQKVQDMHSNSHHGCHHGMTPLAYGP